MGPKVRRTGIKVDIARLQHELATKYLRYFDPERGVRELCIVSEPGAENGLFSCAGAQGPNVELTRRYSEIVSEFNGSYFAEVVSQFPVARRRARLLLADPGRCYEMHYDEELRYHL